MEHIYRKMAPPLDSNYLSLEDDPRDAIFTTDYLAQSDHLLNKREAPKATTQNSSSDQPGNKNFICNI